ncbi:MAG: hypothetical protein VB092_05735 [Oscillospiraceae bacterium]|nr:hypothetical protein [Oscillospiraceae bacterium]
MDTLTAVAVSFLAALGILYLAGALLEFIFRRELRRGVLFVDADPALIALLRSTRCAGLAVGYPETVVVCTHGEASAQCAACPRGDCGACGTHTES